MIADRLLSRLARVKQTGKGRWRCACPAHGEHKKLTLAVREADDGRVLIHCFGGCSVPEVVAAVGMELHDLFPPKPDDDRNRNARFGIDPRDALALLEHEVRTAALLIAACADIDGLVPDSVAIRLSEASNRITLARDACAS